MENNLFELYVEKVTKEAEEAKQEKKGRITMAFDFDKEIFPRHVHTVEPIRYNSRDITPEWTMVDSSVPTSGGWATTTSGGWTTTTNTSTEYRRPVDQQNITLDETIANTARDALRRNIFYTDSSSIINELRRMREEEVQRQAEALIRYTEQVTVLSERVAPSLDEGGSTFIMNGQSRSVDVNGHNR